MEDERSKRGREGERGRTLGWVLPCLSVGGGVKLNYPLVPRLPGDVCRGAGALALPPVCRGLHRCPCSCRCTHTHIHTQTHTRALPPPRRRFQLKSTPGVGPDPVPRSAPRPVDTGTVLISPPNRRICSARCAPLILPHQLSDSFSPRRVSAVLCALRALTRFCITVLRATAVYSHVLTARISCYVIWQRCYVIWLSAGTVAVIYLSCVHIQFCCVDSFHEKSSRAGNYVSSDLAYPIQRERATRKIVRHKLFSRNLFKRENLINNV